jgi:hypothetical protein
MRTSSAPSRITAPATQPPRQRIPLHRPEQYAEYQGAHVARAQQ